LPNADTITGMNQHARAFDRNPSIAALSKALLLQQLRLIAAMGGFHHAFVHRVAPADASLSKQVVLHNLRNFNVQGLALEALVPVEALNGLRASPLPQRWAHPEGAGGPAAEWRARIHWHCGISIPFHTAHGVHAAITFGDARDGLADAELPRFWTDALRLGSRVLFDQPPAQNGLKPRERDCLQWAAAGKTAAETATILGLSQHTVNQHVLAATARLGAVNRTQAVAKAIRSGLIDLSGI
jgi:LuxR family transcriptional regulator, quorum-sensing system regulator BjaR1